MVSFFVQNNSFPEFKSPKNVIFKQCASSIVNPREKVALLQQKFWPLESSDDSLYFLATCT